MVVRKADGVKIVPEQAASQPFDQAVFSA